MDRERSEQEGCFAAMAEGRGARANERREKLIKTARKLFAENGFHSTGMAQIAKESRVLVGQIYRDFANKEEIVALIAERQLEDFLECSSLRSSVEANDADAVREWIRHFIAATDVQDLSLIAEILAESSRNARIAGVFHSIDERLRTSVTTAVAMLAPNAPQQAICLLTDVIITVSAGVIHRRIGQLGPTDPETLAALTRTILREIDRLTADAPRNDEEISSSR